MDQLLDLSFIGLAVIFSVWIVWTLKSYFYSLKLASSSVLSWEPRRPWFYGMCLGIGFFMIVMVFLNGFILHRPFFNVLAQGLMAIYYVVVFPLGFRIRRGFFDSGIWAERKFLHYRQIRWFGWKEHPELLLVLRYEKRFSDQGYCFLRVPGNHYGEARRILSDRLKDNSISLEESLLGLEAKVSMEEPV